MSFEPLFVKGKRDKSRRYIDTTSGEIVSRRQAEKQAFKARELKAKQRKAVAKAAPQPISSSPKGLTYYKRMLRTYTDRSNRDSMRHGLPQRSLKQVRESTDFKAFYKSLKSKDNSPTGKKAQALVQAGWRNKDADYPVGETPPAS